MNSWQNHPVIYEINTWVWLNELSRKYERPLTLAPVDRGIEKNGTRQPT